MKKVLVFGAGMIAGPLVDYLLNHQFAVTVTDIDVSKAQRLIKGHPGATARSFDVNRDEEIGRTLIGDADIVVSLLPAQKHPIIGRLCVAGGKHLVTTSYVSAAMKVLHEQAQSRGLLLLNEMGLDPGLDHMSAMQILEEHAKAGAQCESFISWCGGLPSPQANDNLFGYKFSWAPRGVLSAAVNPARYRKDGVLVEVPAEKLFSNPALISIAGCGTFEGYPNRDSTAYIATYGLSDHITTMFRGTLRNLNHCDLFDSLIRLGLLKQEPLYQVENWTFRSFMEMIFGKPCERALADLLPPNNRDRVLEALRSIGMFNEELIGLQQASALDVLAQAMMNNLRYKDGEQDMVIMRHEMIFKYPDMHRLATTSTLVQYGKPGGASAMAQTVGLPAAIGVRLILNGNIKTTGVAIPTTAQIYNPILTELQSYGITFSPTRQSI